MEQIKHTPGPWAIQCHTCNTPEDLGPGDDWTIRGADGRAVCCETGANPAAAWNARLISRAPELLDALRECTDDLEAEIQARAAGELPRRIERDMATVLRAREIISKAIGA